MSPLATYEPQTIGQIFWSLWWLWSAVILMPMFVSTWLYYKQTKMKREIKWILLELHVPRETRKSPRAMEQVLGTINTLGNYPGDFQEMYMDGEVTRWYSLEMVSFGGEVHFYIRAYAKQRGLIEAAFYSYYSDLEIEEVPDYTERFPHNLIEMDERGYNLWGSEMLLDKSSAYPIKSYLDFEAIDEDKQFDPISAFLEVLSKLKPEEIVGIQILIQPVRPEWRDEFKPVVEELKAKASLKPEAMAGEALAALGKAMRTPGETEVLRAVERNLSHPAFKTLIRFIYLSPKSMFYDSFARRGLVGSFNQYAAYDMNHFVQNYSMSTRVRLWHWPHFFPRRREQVRKSRLLLYYCKREIPTKPFMGKLISSYFMNWNFASKMYIMTTESLATLFHPPTFVVLTAPHVKRVESRKYAPPAGLPIYGEDRDVDKLK